MMIVRPDDMIGIRFYLEDGTMFCTHTRSWCASIFPILEKYRLDALRMFNAYPIYVVVSTCRGVFNYRWSLFASRFISIDNHTKQYWKVRSDYEKAHKAKMYVITASMHSVPL